MSDEGAGQNWYWTYAEEQFMGRQMALLEEIRTMGEKVSSTILRLEKENAELRAKVRRLEDRNAQDLDADA